jgi:hypothetical protein
MTAITITTAAISISGLQWSGRRSVTARTPLGAANAPPPARKSQPA